MVVRASHDVLPDKIFGMTVEFPAKLVKRRQLNATGVKVDTNVGAVSASEDDLRTFEEVAHSNDKHSEFLCTKDDKGLLPLPIPLDFAEKLGGGDLPP
jgi:hypothetical protein